MTLLKYGFIPIFPWLWSEEDAIGSSSLNKGYSTLLDRDYQKFFFRTDFSVSGHALMFSWISFWKRDDGSWSVETLMTEELLK